MVTHGKSIFRAVFGSELAVKKYKFQVLKIYFQRSFGRTDQMFSNLIRGMISPSEYLTLHVTLYTAST